MSVIQIQTRQLQLFDQQIVKAQAAIKTLEDTIISLSSSGHEVTDATKHLREMLDSLTELLRRKRMRGSRLPSSTTGAVSP